MRASTCYTRSLLECYICFQSSTARAYVNFTELELRQIHKTVAKIVIGYSHMKNNKIITGVITESFYKQSEYPLLKKNAVNVILYKWQSNAT